MVWSRAGPGVGPAAVYARVAYSCAYGAGLCPLEVSSAHRPSFSGHTLLCVPHIEECATASFVENWGRAKFGDLEQHGAGRGKRTKSGINKQSL